jgi:hypothetical protein
MLFDQIQRKATPSNDMIVPSFAQFKTLPVLGMLRSCSLPVLQRWPAKGKSSQPLPSLSALLDDNLKTWTENARSGFALLLGVQNWVPISKTIIHPVERALAWFQCTKCHSVSGRSKITQSLSFSNACSHVCRQLNRSQRAKADWKPSMFEVDQKVN